MPSPRHAAPSTTTPLQALTLMNHSFTLDMAQVLAQRVESEVDGVAAVPLRAERV